MARVSRAFTSTGEDTFYPKIESELHTQSAAKVVKK